MKKQFLLVLSLAVLFLGLGRADAIAATDDDSTSVRNKAPLEDRFAKNKLDDLEQRVEMLSEDMRYLRDKFRDLERSVDNVRESTRR